jgi:uncharacterized damage-inducible protein DinB
MDVRALLIELHGRVRPLVEGAVAGLSPAQLTSAPNPDANTIGWLVWHLTRVQDHYLAELVGDGQLLLTFADRFGRAPDPDDTGYGHSPVEVTSVRPESTEALIEYHAAVQQRLMSFLGGLSEEDLDRVVDESWDPPVTLGVRLVSVADDALQHAGQAAYVRGLLLGGSG